MAAPSLKLANGSQIPQLGLGVWRADKGVVGSVIKAAIKAGYRHFDCAADYGNEAEVGEALDEAIKEGLVTRQDLFITTKLWNSDHGHVRDAFLHSLQQLRLTYVDLYLVHFPIATKHTGIGVGGIEKDDTGTMILDTSVSLEQTWKGMEALLDDGLVKSIGISNYGLMQVADLLTYARIRPVTNQVETHPYFQRPDLVRFCHTNGITITAHTPLGGGSANPWMDLHKRSGPLEDPTIKEIASRHGKTAAQVCLRWGVQRGTIVIPKTVNESRLKENLDVFGFTLTDSEMQQINGLDLNARCNDPAQAWGIDIYA